MQQFVESLLETTVTEARSTAVSVATAQEVMANRVAALEAALGNIVTSVGNQQTAMTTSIQSVAAYVINACPPEFCFYSYYTIPGNRTGAHSGVPFWVSPSHSLQGVVIATGCT